MCLLCFAKSDSISILCLFWMGIFCLSLHSSVIFCYASLEGMVTGSPVTKKERRPFEFLVEQ
jgi:hypothetical protein